MQNIMLHMLENLSQKQNDLERKMRDTSAELLENCRQSTALRLRRPNGVTASMKYRTQITVLRNRLDHVDELPVALGKGKNDQPK